MPAEGSAWQPISVEELDVLIVDQLAECTDDLQAWFIRARFPATKWQLSPWGDLGGGFWAIASADDRVLWYNDIEDGFSVSHFTTWGVIPSDEYWCNQDPLFSGLRALAGFSGGKLGPPTSMNS